MVIGIDAIHKHLCYFWNWICAIRRFHIIAKIINLVIAISSKMNLLMQKDIKMLEKRRITNMVSIKETNR
jgi:hypothetical protein